MLALAILIFFQCVGCDNRAPKIIGSKASPDGAHTLWITEESGGLRSGVTAIHLARTGDAPEAKNEILNSPECEGMKVAWHDSDNIITGYDSVYGSFHSELRALKPKVSLVRNADIKRLGFDMKEYLSVPCDPL